MNFRTIDALLLASQLSLSSRQQLLFFSNQGIGRLVASSRKHREDLKMSGCSKSPKNDRHSIKYRWNQHGGPSFNADISCVDLKPSLSKIENKQCYKNSELKSPELLSTAKLISAVGQIWDSANHPFSIFLPKENDNQDDKGVQKEKILDSYGEKRNSKAYSSNKTNYFPVDMKATDPRIVQENLEFPKVIDKILVLKSCNESQDNIYSLLDRFLHASPNNSNESWKAKELVTEEISFKLRSKNWWLSRIVPIRLKYPVKVTEPENTKPPALAAGSCISADTTTRTPALVNEGHKSNHELITNGSPPSSNNAMLDMRKVSSLSLEYSLGAVHDTMTDIGDSQTISAGICADYHINSLTDCDSVSEGCQRMIDKNNLLKTKRGQFLHTIKDEECKVEVFSSTNQKHFYSLPKQEHAFSGALAGICVSLCLHPIDTIKTVIQSRCAEQKSIFYIGKSIVSDRGLPGLYRGITTNIASSAPISAVYTFTYESVKSALLPHLPKEFYSSAHCMAGGFASIATSFIFTPSERIKQQMQVRSHYRNCWDALVGIIRNGGFRSLYAGWGAVLCRNVPHSIIKFYTYESLKQKMSSLPCSIRSSTFQTLVCGGLAGSTAALFTTPFDVIKTRLQTQIPGSSNQYDSVFHALCNIGKNEGLKGLYRGLTPRLIMYMSQGSLFFASYEFFKSLFSLEASHPTALKVHVDEGMETNEKN